MAARLSAAEVLKVAQLARLRLTAAEIEDHAAKLEKVLGYVDSLNEVNTDDIEPMVHAIELSGVFREDVVAPSLPVTEALANAPRSDGRLFLVPQILDGA